MLELKPAICFSLQQILTEAICPSLATDTWLLWPLVTRCIHFRPVCSILALTCGSYVAGLFNGQLTSGPSHRARIPSTANIAVAEGALIGSALDMEQAVFYRRTAVTSGAPEHLVMALFFLSTVFSAWRLRT
jgi:hypothetical protein